MTPIYLEFLVEELSAERALDVLVPRIVPGVAFEVRTFNGKPDLLRKLPARLAGYASYARQAGVGVVVLADRDGDDCRELKSRLEKVRASAGLPSLSTSTDSAPAVVANRIACEELEAWFFGDVIALTRAFPGVPPSLGDRAAYRDPDAVVGGTAEALERVLKEHGHHTAGLRKTEAARAIATHMDVDANRSTSFTMFRDGVRRLVGGEH